MADVDQLATALDTFEVFMSAECGLLFAAIAAAQTEMPPAEFDSINPHFRSRYASLASIRNAAVPSLAKHGIAVSQIPMGLKLVTLFGHKSNQWLAGYYLIAAGSPQAQGSHLTYARRYSLASMAGVVAEEDDDGEAAEAARDVSRETKPISAHASRKTGFYPLAEKAIRNQPSLESLKQWWIDNQDEIRALAPSWIVKLEEEKDRRKLQLIDEIGNETEMTDFKKKLKESLHNEE